MKEFCQELDVLAHEIYHFNQVNCRKPQVRTPQDVAIFNDAIECKYCKETFSSLVPRVWHHDHISGDFIGALCQKCNTMIRQPMTTLPIFFHNLRNYDMHAMCLEGFSQMKNWHLKPIAQTKEKYVTLTAKTQVAED